MRYTKLLGIVLICMAGLCMAPLAFSEDTSPRDMEGWSMVGAGNPKPAKNNKLGNSYIYLDSQAKPPGKLIIEVQGAAIYVAKISVYRTGGDVQDVSQGKYIEAGTLTEPIFLPSHKDPVEKVMLRFRSKRKAHITLWGR